MKIPQFKVAYSLASRFTWLFTLFFGGNVELCVFVRKMRLSPSSSAWPNIVRKAIYLNEMMSGRSLIERYLSSALILGYISYHTPSLTIFSYFYFLTRPCLSITMLLFESQDCGIGSLVAAIARSKPNGIAIVADETAISYQDLHLEAQLLCCKMVGAGIASEDIVGILTSHGVEHIIAQLAIIYAGGTCLPLDATLSEADLKARIAFVKPRYMVVDNNNQCRVTFEVTVFVMDTPGLPISQSPVEMFPKTPFLPKDTPSEFRSHIMFSSGTTGLPKAIQILDRGILRLARDEIWEESESVSEPRFGHINSTSFDTSLVDIWVALLRGATIVVVDRQELLNPCAFARILAEKKIATLVITSSLFSRIAGFYPSTFSTMQTLFVVGELPSISACKSVLQNGAPKKLVNGYGPTECSVMAFLHVITQEDLAQARMPLGRPARETDVYILDESGKEVTSPGIGELWLGGPGLSPGYLFDDKRTSETFLNLEHPRDSTRHIRLYRTGDRIEVHDNYKSWVGRQNREVKINGHRVHLDVIEMELHQTGLIENVTALRYESPLLDIGHLIACVVYKNGQRAFDALLTEARRRLPKYMVPGFIEFEQLPLNSNGKIDQKKTLYLLKQKLQERYSHVIAASAPDFEGLNKTEKTLKQL